MNTKMTIGILAIVGLLVGVSGAQSTQNVTVASTIIGATLAQTSFVVPVYQAGGIFYHSPQDQGLGIITAEPWTVVYLGNGNYSLSDFSWQ